MSSEIIKKYLADLKKEGKYDDKFIDILMVGNDEDEDGGIIAAKVIESINQRYVESKKNQT